MTNSRLRNPYTYPILNQVESRRGHRRPARISTSHSRMFLVPNGAADQPRRRDHVEAVEQAEPAQKPFGQSGIRLRGAEELIEQPADRFVPPGHRGAARCSTRSPIAFIVDTGNVVFAIGEKWHCSRRSPDGGAVDCRPEIRVQFTKR